LTGGRADVATISLLGGHLALDFANTIEDRTGDHPEDTLRSTDDLRRWGVRVAALDDTATAAPQELARALALRAHLLELLAALTEDRPLALRDTDALADAAANAYANGRLVPAADGVLGWSWDPSHLATVRHTVAVTALDLLSGPMSSRIHRCANPDCGWYVLDTSKNASRRWCSMAGCGNLAKTRRRRLDRPAR